MSRTAPPTTSTIPAAVEETSNKEGAAHGRPLKPPRDKWQYRCVKRRAVMRALGRQGFYVARKVGKHFVYTHGQFGGSVPVSKHDPTIANGTFAKICRLVNEITGEDLDV